MKGGGGCFLCGGGHLARDCATVGKGYGKGRGTSSSSGKGQGGKSGRVCRNFSSTGTCRFGAACHFQHQGSAQAAVEAAPEHAVNIVVNGLSGPRCTIEASSAWTVLQVKAALYEKIAVSVARQTLLKDTERLAGQVTVTELISGEPPERLELTLVVEPPRPVEFVGMTYGLEQLEHGHLRKTGFAMGPSTAVSSGSLVVGQGRGLRFRPGTVDKSVTIGLGSQRSFPGGLRGIDYAANCREDGHFQVYKNGDLEFRGSRYTRNAEVDLLVHGDRVEFLLDGVLQYTSQLQGEAQLYAMACFLGEGAEAVEIQWL